MELRLRDLAPIDPLGVPLPIGEEAARRRLAGAPGPLGRGAPPCPEVSFEEDGDA